MTSQEVALRDAVQGTVAQFRDPAFEQQVQLAVPENVSPRKLLRAAATAVLENPKLARDDLRESLIRATLKTAQDGLLPDGREAAFVIFEGKNPSVAYMPMILGFRKIAAEYGWAIMTAIVHENDTFDPDLAEQKPNHRPARLGTDPGHPIGAYAVAQHKDGRRMLETMDMAEIEKIRQVSRAKDRGPWVDWWEQMAQIRPARRLFKKLPLDPKDRERIDRVLAATGEDGIVELYGEDSPPATTGGDRAPQVEAPAGPPPLEPGQGATAGSGTDPAVPGSDEVPFEGEEPPPVADEPTFPTIEYSGKQLRYAGKTLRETLEAGEDGLAFLRWAFTAWKTEPLRSALDRFAETYPEITT